ncbi:MAG: HAD-IA family hydrolase [Thermotogota bacterium]|nr:HAD-IA family hydrolase [Thermotogota bacterium]
MTMIRAILFDLDDTLYDEMQFVEGGFKAVSFYISKNNNIDQNTVYQLLLDILKTHGRGHTFDIALKELGFYSEKLVPKLVEIYRTHKPDLSSYPEVREVLSALLKQEYKLGLITDGNAKVQRNKVDGLNVKDFFDCMVFSDECGIGKQKPHPFPYLKAIEELEVDAREAMYVGDNPYKDFVSAKKMGMYTVRILNGQYKDIKLNKESEAEYQIKDLSELSGVIMHIERNTI